MRMAVKEDGTVQRGPKGPAQVEKRLETLEKELPPKPA